LAESRAESAIGTIWSDYHTSEMLMRLPAVDADRLLLKHWDHLRFSPHFVQSALYVSTPRLLEAAGAAVSESPEPAKLFEHLSHHFGLRHVTSARPSEMHAANRSSSVVPTSC